MNPFESIIRATRPLKIAVAKVASKIDLSIYEELTSYCILNTAFKEIYSIPVCKKRETLWDECNEQVGITQKITFVEFGVHEGYSIKYFARENLNKESVFIGLDSF